MKVNGPAGPASPGAPRAGARASGGFSLGGPAAPAAPAPAAASAAAAPVAGLSALMALQGVESATERRRRAIRRGGGLLDRLDELKLALLGGLPAGAALEGLQRAVGESIDEVDDPRLRAVLQQIELRAAVELAKAGRA
ncbi:MAG TPA: flagellar assembly protein FliX [Brevundimonas sp.]|jgi:hypothetical protein|uniref:flagellar assembly protein FliX n=1 Tax=Brevundimonas sp. TaxID=1871086 RepID=UPI002E163D57|nr:flagellar assembly protein FliX [Brevundimonas sp.]